MLLVKGSSYSKNKRTDAKDMLHGADREQICYYSRALHILKRKERMQKICYTERIGKSVELILQGASAIPISMVTRSGADPKEQIS